MRGSIGCKSGERLTVTDALVNIADQFLRVDIGVVPGLPVGVSCRYRYELAVLRVGFGGGSSPYLTPPPQI